jgi:mannosyltransferase OCH1-like enzyme
VLKKVLRPLLKYVYSKIPPINIGFIYTEGRKDSKTRGKDRIPKHVYQTWMRPALPLVLARRVVEFRKMNPEYSFSFFDDGQMAEYMESKYAGQPILKVFKEIYMPAEKADIWRYCILFKEGGIYCDIKSAIKIPIRQVLREDFSELISFEGNEWKNFMSPGFYSDPNVFFPAPPESIRSNLDYPDRVICNWFLCFEKGSPILEEAINQIVRHATFYRGRRFEKVSIAGNHFTGPLAFTQAVWHWMDRTGKRPGQGGVDLRGQGIWKLPGMDYSASPHHTTLRDLTLLD